MYVRAQRSIVLLVMSGPSSLIQSFLQLLHLSCIFVLLDLFTLSSTAYFVPPSIHYDITSASLWKCYHEMEPNSVYELINNPEQNGMEIIHLEGNWIEILSSKSSEDIFKSMGLDQCYQLVEMRDLIEDELRQNWESLKHHVSPEMSEISDDRYSSNIQDDGNKNGRMVRSAEDNDQYQFSYYLNFTSMTQWYETLAASHPSKITLHRSIGKTHYGRDIMALHITDKSSSIGANKRPKIYIQCLLHSREWITGPVCMYIAKKIIEDSLFADLLQKVEIVIVPVANPDGYYLTWYDYPKYRLWRKNVQPIEGTVCAGVDLNRNFDSHWNADSLSRSTSPCSEVYHGSAANSELEVQAIINHLKSLGSSVIGAIDFHSFHQKVLYPPAATHNNPDNIESIRQTAKLVAAAASEVGVTYETSRMIDIYSASGTFADWLLDWSKSEGGCRSMIPLTIELRPSFEELMNKTLSFETGFLLPPSEILPGCTEMLFAFKEFSELVLDSGKSCSC